VISADMINSVSDFEIVMSWYKQEEGGWKRRLPERCWESEWGCSLERVLIKIFFLISLCIFAEISNFI
jgi:hypothetical protein